MDEQSTNGALPEWLSQRPVATITAPSQPVIPIPQPTIPPPPPPPAPAAADVQPQQPVTSAAAHTQPQAPQQPQPVEWPSHPAESPPLAERAPARPPARQPRADVVRVDDEAAPSTIRDRLRAQRPFIRAMVLVSIALALIICVNVVINHFGSVIGKAAAKAAPAPAPAAPAAQVVTMNVTNPLSWLPCPLTPDAKGMISYDPPGSTTLNEGRAAGVDQQAHLLLASHNAAELRITQPDSTHLIVFVGAPTIGVPLIDCSQSDSAVPQTTPTTVAPR